MTSRDPILVDLALQGGGAHGAFTWGVLDRLLEEDWLRIDGISGTSAGAMNAAVLVDRHAEDGPGGILARGLAGGHAQPVPAHPSRHAARSLDAGFLPGVRRHGPDVAPVFALRAEPGRDQPIERHSGQVHRLRPGGARSDQAVRHRHQCPHRPRPCDVLLASACLPTIFQAIEIDGESYWDGGYSGNPTITPLVRECASKDTILVAINPVERPGTPRTARDILNRLNEVSFNAVL